MKNLFILVLFLVIASGCSVKEFNQYANSQSIKPMHIYPKTTTAKDFKPYYPIPSVSQTTSKKAPNLMPPGIITKHPVKIFQKTMQANANAQSNKQSHNFIVNTIENTMSKID